MGTIPLSVTILTKNSEKYLAEVLAPLEVFDEIVVYDTGSEDKTMEIARSFQNVTLYERPFIGFGPTHNIASSVCRNDWILSIDSDEVVTEELIKEISSLTLQRGSVYSFPRHNEYRGTWIQWCGWHPDRQVRIYNRLDTQFTGAQVHESVETRHMKEVKLQAPLRHYSYDSIDDFLAKMQSYSTLFARQYKGKRSSSMGKAIAHGLFAFVKSYLLKRGFLGGKKGFEISVYNGNTAFYKYLKLAEANEKLAEKCGGDPKKKEAL